MLPTFARPRRFGLSRQSALRALLLLTTLLVQLTGMSPELAYAADGFLEPGEAFVLTVEPSDTAATTDLRLHWKIAPGYYLYRERIGVTATPAGSLEVVDKPAGERKEDPNFGVMEVYHDAVTVPVHAPGAKELVISWQGCAEAGLCYPPQTRRISLAATAATSSVKAAPADTAKGFLLDATDASDSRITQLLGERSLAWTLPLFFLLGIALAFTPCTLPMVPIVSGIVVGSQATPKRAFALSLAFVLPMALTYALLGAAAGVIGANLQALLQNRWTVSTFGAIFVVLAAAMFGFFTLQLPSFVRERLDNASRHRRGGTLSGAAALGLLSALLVGPCMTAPLAGALLYISQTGNIMSGTLLLFALGLGTGLPLLLMATLGARYLPKPGPWMERVKGACAFLLLATAVWMVQRVVPAPLALALWGMLLASFALTLAHVAAGATTGVRLLGRSVALMAGLWGCAMVLGAAAGSGDPWRPLAFARVASAAPAGAAGQASSLPFDTVRSLQALQAQLDIARAAGRPVLVDVSADWCVACKAIEHEVFADAQARQALAGMVLLRADVTAGDAGQRALMRQYQVLGPPTVMLFDASGQERRDARLVGEFGVADLVQRLATEGSRPGDRS